MMQLPSLRTIDLTVLCDCPCIFLLPDAGRRVGLRETGRGAAVELADAIVVQPRNADELLGMLAEAALHRATSATQMNEASSRSHALLALRVSPADGGEHGVSGVLHIVDLAGSERIKRSGAVGGRLAEATAINSSLLALGRVVDALTQPGGDFDGGGLKSTAPAEHVPYRESILTRLLADALGGNSRTALVACVSPSADSAEETHATLRFAAQATFVKVRRDTRVHVNVLTGQKVQAQMHPRTHAYLAYLCHAEQCRGYRTRARACALRGCIDSPRAIRSSCGCRRPFQQFFPLLHHREPQHSQCRQENGRKETNGWSGSLWRFWSGAENYFCPFLSLRLCGACLGKSSFPVGYQQANRQTRRLSQGPSAPVLLCLHYYGHGSPGGQQFVEWFLALREAGFRVLAPSFPGHGNTSGAAFSSKPDPDALAGEPATFVTAVLDHFGVKSCAILGHDWGGGVAWEYAARLPQRVTAVIGHSISYRGAERGSLALLQRRYASTGASGGGGGSKQSKPKKKKKRLLLCWMESEVHLKKKGLALAKAAGVKLRECDDSDEVLRNVVSFLSGLQGDRTAAGAAGGGAAAAVPSGMCSWQGDRAAAE